MIPIALIRPARASDAADIGAVHARAWQETYRGDVPDAVLDDPEEPRRRADMWGNMLSRPIGSDRFLNVAEIEGTVVGIAMSGPAEEPDVPGASELKVLYVLAEQHGTGLGARLLNSVLDPDSLAVLWVLDPNPRAQRFYRKHGFVPDGAAQAWEYDTREIRMVRAGKRHPRPGDVTA
ncbi:GNAT superfamily N-acetyltransferase [Mycetocola sp. BIGb0189]|uniref:GNAT family N-acetyltransferase n=1 Tax=Mycetocola sp. BIGb0189 TaxID=2940604 RepID=UPI002167ECC6|nr:GNAT family N-acetyltransferase [Mycetocola sp. BIGb0189]MCS4277944.1 GNAT superfamily N-acetyltransferase [Mycetocola sp. BIGb0189]